MKLTSKSFQDGGRIPEEFAFGKHHPEEHIELSANRNPQLGWDNVPEGTKSLVLICHDIDAPTSGECVNQENKTVPYDLPRTDFFHWVLVDIEVDRREILPGEFSNGVSIGGKPGPEAKKRMRTGLNDYTNWFASDEKMAGRYFGYDGPCPPWNDERLHHYRFTLYALNIDTCPVSNDFTGQDVMAAITPLTLASSTIVGIYHIYPEAR